jgi:hypothetical protein
VSKIGQLFRRAIASAILIAFVSATPAVATGTGATTETVHLDDYSCFSTGIEEYCFGITGVINYTFTPSGNNISIFNATTVATYSLLGEVLLVRIDRTASHLLHTVEIGLQQMSQLTRTTLTVRGMTVECRTHFLFAETRYVFDRLDCAPA